MLIPHAPDERLSLPRPATPPLAHESTFVHFPPISFRGSSGGLQFVAVVVPRLFFNCSIFFQYF
jgi:hypothetical protein